MNETYAKDQVMRLYFCQLTLDRGKVSASHPGNQAAEMKLDEFVPLFGTDTGVVGTGVGSTSSQDVAGDGAAVTKDAARAERKRDVSMSLGLKERVGWGIG